MPDTTVSSRSGTAPRTAGRGALPLRAKATLLAALGAVAGLTLGLVDAALGAPVWPMLIGLAVTMMALTWLAQAWVAAPMDGLVRQLELMARGSRPQALGELPTGREDEVGRIARSVQRIAAEAVRNYQEAKQLRATLDTRVAVATDHAVRQLRQMALRDPLTDLGNRRFLDEHLESLVKVSLASHADLVCLLIDIDKFKEVNDTLGHQKGDELLVMIAGLIRASVRHDDLTIRLGGDEFVVLMPGAGMARVEALAEALRKHLRQQARVMLPDGPHPDLSIGIASLLMDHCETGDKLIAVADARLYEAKRQGRGRTIGVNDHVVHAIVPPNLQMAV